ncbi:MAG: AAA family ATPase [Mariprofundaceae bacterium]|nr:AAA family ATPase [Mariprofundaceae bacterium]
MSLIKFSYSEFEGQATHWSFSNATFSDINLIVGKNASGKSRLLAVINSFAQLLAGKRVVPFESCDFNVLINLNGEIFSYELTFRDSKINSEILKVDSKDKLTRKNDGSGKIFYENEDKFLNFKIPNDALATVNRRDEIQHPFLMELNKWANSAVVYLFGSDFGRSAILGMPEAEVFLNKSKAVIFDDPSNLVKVYSSALTEYGEDFDKSIISDMNQLGYSLSGVGCENLQFSVNFPIAALGVFVVEKDLDFHNFQIHMSQGMFRALALIIHLNLCSFSHNKQVVIIDDIGEGLDYTRSVAIIELLIAKAEENHFQLIMTTNDRFVMNKVPLEYWSVPLEYWSVLKRKGGEVSLYNSKNSKEKFDEFKYVGLNNFDFFASNFLEVSN